MLYALTQLNTNVSFAFPHKDQETEHWAVDECRLNSGISAGVTSWFDFVGAPRQLSLLHPFGKSLALPMRPVRVVSRKARHLFYVRATAASGRSMQCC